MKNSSLAILGLIIVFIFDKVFLQSYMKIPSRFLKQIVYFDSSKQTPKRLIPNLNKTIVGAYREYTFKVSTNSEGFRGPIENSDTLVLGDSQTFGIGVNDNETFSHLIRAFNTGCPGYNTKEEYQILSDVLKTKNYKKVILAFFAGNDPYENYRNSGLAIFGKKSFDLKNWLKKNSGFYNLLSTSLPVKRIVPDELEIFKKERTEKQIHHWKSTKDLILKINDIVKEKLIVLFIPDHYQVDDNYWKKWVKKYGLKNEYFDLRNPNKEMEKFLRENNINFLDATDYLQGDCYFKIDNHLNKKGHRIIANLLQNQKERI